MKVVVLCGGQGTRLREETEFRPKPMVEIGGKPILWHIMKIYSHYGFDDFILCLGYKGELIKEYFSNYDLWNQDFTVELGKNRKLEIHRADGHENWRVTLADTGKTALKGARIKKIEQYLDGDDDFMLTYGDGVANVNLHKLLKFHREHGKKITVTGVRPPSLFGELKVQNSRVVSFSEKSQTSTGFINGGFFVLSKTTLGDLTTKDDCDFEFGLLEQLAANGELMVYEHAGDWSCMDTFRDMEHLNKLWQRNQAFWKVW